MNKKMFLVSLMGLFSLKTSYLMASSYFSDYRVFENPVNAPKGLCVGEFNQDNSSMDGFVALSADSKIGQLVYGEGHGFSFISGATTTVGNNPVSVAAADFRGNGTIQIAAFVQEGEAGLLFYLATTNNNGILSFQNEAGNPLGLFSPRTTGGPEAVAVGKLDSDANFDVMSVSDVGNSSDGYLYAYYGFSENLASGSAELSDSRHSPNSVAITDYNKDGTGDYIVTSTITNSINVLLGSGNWSEVANFADLSYFTEVGAQPWGLAVADLNNDTYPDIITANRGSDSISIVLNNADGTRASTLNQTLTNVCDEPIDVEIEDFNNDTKPDVAVLCAADGFLKVYAGNNDGTFNSTAIFEKDLGENAFDIVTADFNGDGHADLLASVTGSNKIVTLLGNDEPMLSNPSVDGTAGTFQIAYTDADNEAPATIQVTIDGTPYNMIESDSTDTNFTDGKVYTLTQALSVGTHTYRFSANDGTYAAVSNPISLASTDQTITIAPAASSGGGCSLSVASGQMSAVNWLASIFLLCASRVWRRKDYFSK